MTLFLIVAVLVAVTWWALARRHRIRLRDYDAGETGRGPVEREGRPTTRTDRESGPTLDSRPDGGGAPRPRHH